MLLNSRCMVGDEPMRCLGPASQPTFACRFDGPNCLQPLWRVQEQDSLVMAR